MTNSPKSNAEPGPLGFYSDAARRIADWFRLHLMADPVGNEGRWMAFRLDDGTCDTTLYDSRSDAIRAKGLFAKHWGVIKLIPTGINYQAAESYLKTCRMVADNPNLRWKATDAESPVSVADQLLMPMNREDFRRPR